MEAAFGVIAVSLDRFFRPRISGGVRRAGTYDARLFLLQTFPVPPEVVVANGQAVAGAPFVSSA